MSIVYTRKRYLQQMIIKTVRRPEETLYINLGVEKPGTKASL